MKSPSAHQTQSFHSRFLLPTCLIATILVLTGIPQEIRAENSSDAEPSVEIPWLEAVSLIIQPVYFVGKVVMGVGGTVASIVAAIVTGGDEESTRKIFYASWDDPWTLADFIRGKNTDPLMSDNQE